MTKRMSSCMSAFYMFSEETEEATSGGGGVVEHHQHATPSKLGDVDMDKSNPWFNNGSYEFFSINRPVPKRKESIIKKVLPMVKSAIEEYCVPCKLTLWRNFIRFLTTTRSVDLDSFVMVRELLLLLSINVPADKAITVLTGRQWLIVLTGSDVKEGLCKKFGIKRGQFLERNKLLLASNKELEQITGCDIFITEGYVLGIGQLKGLKLVQRIVKDCILHNVPPASRIRTVKKTLKTMKKFEGLRLCD